MRKKGMRKKGMRSWMAIFKTKQLRTGSVSLPSCFMFCCSYYGWKYCRRQLITVYLHTCVVLSLKLWRITIQLYVLVGSHCSAMVKRNEIRTRTLI